MRFPTEKAKSNFSCPNREESIQARLLQGSAWSLLGLPGPSCSGQLSPLWPFPDASALPRCEAQRQPELWLSISPDSASLSLWTQPLPVGTLPSRVHLPILVHHPSPGPALKRLAFPGTGGLALQRARILFAQAPDLGPSDPR